MVERTPPVTLAAAILVVAGGITADILLGACGLHPSVQAVRFTITRSGVSPANFTGSPAMVAFANEDSQPHDIRSNPHPAHTDCSELNIGILAPGQVLTIVNTFERGRSCGFHDDTRPDDANFQGAIVIR